MAIVLAGAACALIYLFGSSLIWHRLAGPDQEAEGHRRGLVTLGWVAAGLHALALYPALLGPAGPDLGVAGAASLVAWLTVIVLLLDRGGRRLHTLGGLVLPVAAVAALAGILFPGTAPTSIQSGIGFRTHVLTSVLAYAVLTLAACQTLVLAYQERRLGHHRPGGALRLLPPLQEQEVTLFRFLGAGFFLLSLSLVSGVMFMEDIFAQHLAHKTTLSFVAWLIFGALLWGRWRWGWRGRTATRLSLAGFATLLLAYFGSKLVLELVLGRHWYAS